MVRGPLSQSIVFAVLALVCVGCASRGNEVLKSQDAATVNQLIVDGHTTRDEVQRTYGSPTQTTFLSVKEEMWTYRWERATAQSQNFIPVIGPFARGYDVRKKELVIVFNEQNVVVRHSMIDNADVVRSGLVDTGAPHTAGVPVSAITSQAAIGVVATPSQPTATPSAPVATSPSTSGTASAGNVQVPVEAGAWTCGIKNIGNTTRPFYTLQFIVASDRTVTIVSYANARAVVLKSSPLTFTAINPRGSRLTTFTWMPDNSMTITGPGINNPTVPFYNEGTCEKA